MKPARPRRACSAVRSLFETPKSVRRLACMRLQVDLRREDVVHVAHLRIPASKAIERIASANTVPPTVLTTRFAPLPSVASSTRAWKSAPRVQMATLEPQRPSLSSFSREPEVPNTFAPRSLAACSAATPTPEETPSTSTHSPASRRPCANRMS